MKTLILGLAAGVILGYFLASEDKEELIDGAMNAVNKVKDFVKEGVQKGKNTISAAQDMLRDAEV